MTPPGQGSSVTSTPALLAETAFVRLDHLTRTAQAVVDAHKHGRVAELVQQLKSLEASLVQAQDFLDRNPWAEQQIVALLTASNAFVVGAET